jgi:hypothetical protein
MLHYWHAQNDDAEKKSVNMLAHVVKHMATKEDIADLRRELKGDIVAARSRLTRSRPNCAA